MPQKSFKNTASRNFSRGTGSVKTSGPNRFGSGTNDILTLKNLFYNNMSFEQSSLDRSKDRLERNMQRCFWRKKESATDTTIEAIKS